MNQQTKKKKRKVINKRTAMSINKSTNQLKTKQTKMKTKKKQKKISNER